MVPAQRAIQPRKRAKATKQVPRGEFTWSTFMERHTRAHLLMGSFESPVETFGRHQAQLALLKRLARENCRRGSHAVTILRSADGGGLAMLAIEHHDDALLVARVLQGRIAAPFGPWLSHWAFSIDAAACRRFARQSTRAGPTRS